MPGCLSLRCVINFHSSHQTLNVSLLAHQPKTNVDTAVAARPLFMALLRFGHPTAEQTDVYLVE